MIKFIKYLFSLLLIIGLSAGERGQYSQSNSAAYCEFSNVVDRKESKISGSSIYRYGRKSICDRILLVVLLAYRELQDTCSDQVRIAFKMRRLLFTEIDPFSPRYHYCRFSNTSRLTPPSLYIA